MTATDDFQGGDGAHEYSGAVRCVFCGAAHRLERRIDRDDECARCASPLYPAERHRHEQSGQRMLARIAKQGAVAVFTVWPPQAPLKGQMRDISLNGMLLVLPAKLAENQIVKIVGEDCAALGRVAHCRRQRLGSELWNIGVEFLTLRFTQHTGTFVSLRV